MANYFALTKVFLKSFRKIKSSKTRTKILYGILIILTLVFFVIPFLVISASFVYDTTIKLIDIEYESIGLQIMCYIICGFTFIFSISALLNALFFSNDIEKLLPLPIKPIELVLSKFTSCFILENIMQIVVILVSIISYMVALDLGIGNIILSLIEIITLPLIPMVYASIFCLIIMYFTRFIKNKEYVKKLSTLFVILLFVLLIGLVNVLKGFDFNLYLENFVNGDHKFLDVMNIIFPHISLFTDTLTNMSFISLIKYLLVNALFFGVFVLLAKYTYLDSVIDLSNKSNTTNKNSTKLLNNIKKKSVIRSYLEKELKVLLRTPSFFINCIIINILWPVILYLLYEIGSINYNLDSMRILLSNGEDKIKIILLLFIVGLSIFLPAMNSIGSTSFSREGKNFQFIKYIPVSYKVQWCVKYLISFIISFLGIFIYTIIFYIMVKLDILTIIEFIIISVLSVSCVSLIGVYVDSIQPKIFWDDENNILRENYNTFISMGIVTFIFAVISIVSYSYLFKSKMLGFNTIYFIIVCVLIIINLLMLLISKKAGIKNIIEQE